MSVLEELNALATAEKQVLHNATAFVKLLGDTLSGLGQPTVHNVSDTLIIEWLTKEYIISVDFEDDDACAMIYSRKTDKTLLHESSTIQDLVDFLEKQYKEIQEQE